MSGFKKNYKACQKARKTQSEDTKQESDLDMTQMLEWSELKITMINKLKALKEKVGNMQEQMSNESRELETIRKNKKEVPKIKGRNEVCVSCTHQ